MCLGTLSLLVFGRNEQPNLDNQILNNYCKILKQPKLFNKKAFQMFVFQNFMFWIPTIVQNFLIFDFLDTP